SEFESDSGESFWTDGDVMENETKNQHEQVDVSQPVSGQNETNHGLSGASSKNTSNGHDEQQLLDYNFVVKEECDEFCECNLEESSQMKEEPSEQNNVEVPLENANPMAQPSTSKSVYTEVSNS